MVTRRTSFLGLALTLAGCAPDQTAPDGPVDMNTGSLSAVEEAGLTFTRPDSELPVVPNSVSFYAVNGQARVGTLYYHRHPDSPDSTPIARLRLDRRSLVRRSDGTPIAPGDSLLITITLRDPDRFIIDFEPSGLRFAPGRTAELTLWYRDANPDFNGDGVIDAADSAVESTFQIWRQELLAQPWFATETDLMADHDEATTEIDGFTRYAVAY